LLGPDGRAAIQTVGYLIFRIKEALLDCAGTVSSRAITGKLVVWPISPSPAKVLERQPTEEPMKFESSWAEERRNGE